MYTIFSKIDFCYLSHLDVHGNTIRDIIWDAVILKDVVDYKEKQVMLDNCFLINSEDLALEYLKMIAKYYEEKESNLEVVKLKPKTVYSVLK